MMRHHTLLAALATAIAVMLGAGVATAQPKTLEDCYLNVAMTKSTADKVYLAPESCDAAFMRVPRTLTVLTPKAKDCA